MCAGVGAGVGEGGETKERHGGRGDQCRALSPQPRFMPASPYKHLGIMIQGWQVEWEGWAGGGINYVRYEERIALARGRPTPHLSEGPG